jgi:hypothetical protein
MRSRLFWRALCLCAARAPLFLQMQINFARNFHTFALFAKMPEFVIKMA